MRHNAGASATYARFPSIGRPYATDGFSSLAPTISILKDNPQKICTSLKDS